MVSFAEPHFLPLPLYSSVSLCVPMPHLSQTPWLPMEAPSGLGVRRTKIITIPPWTNTVTFPWFHDTYKGKTDESRRGHVPLAQTGRTSDSWRISIKPEPVCLDIS
jgi:hypothetical protein